MARTIVDTVPTLGHTYALDAVNEATPWFEAGDNGATALITLEYNGTWNGTVTFETANKSDTAFTGEDPITCTNLNGAAGGTTSTGGASAVEHWKVALPGNASVAVEITTLVAGSVDVTVHLNPGL